MKSFESNKLFYSGLLYPYPNFMHLSRKMITNNNEKEKKRKPKVFQQAPIKLS